MGPALALPGLPIWPARFPCGEMGSGLGGWRGSGFAPIRSLGKAPGLAKGWLHSIIIMGVRLGSGCLEGLTQDLKLLPSTCVPCHPRFSISIPGQIFPVGTRRALSNEKQFFKILFCRLTANGWSVEVGDGRATGFGPIYSFGSTCRLFWLFFRRRPRFIFLCFSSCLARTSRISKPPHCPRSGLGLAQNVLCFGRGVDHPMSPIQFSRTAQPIILLWNLDVEHMAPQPS